MLNWLRNRIHNRRRLLFRFHDGKRIRAVDPVLIAIALDEHPKFVATEHLMQCAEGDKEAQLLVAEAACDVFGVKPLSDDGQAGMSVSERVDLVMAFDLYIQSLASKKKSNAISSRSTEAISSESDGPTTNSTPPSSSTEHDPPSEKPTSNESASSPQAEPTCH